MGGSLPDLLGKAWMRVSASSRLPDLVLGVDSDATPTPPQADRSLPFPASLPRRAARAGRGARRLRRGRGGLLGSLARIKYLLCFVWPLGEGRRGLSHRSGAARRAKGRGQCQARWPKATLPKWHPPTHTHTPRSPATSGLWHCLIAGSRSGR